MRLQGRPGIAYTILVLAIAGVVAILVHDIRTSNQVAKQSKKLAQQSKDFNLAFAYKSEHDQVQLCLHDNSAALARIASAEAIVSISAHANPNLTSTLEQQLLMAAYIKKVNAAIVKNNPIHNCSLPALGLPKLPPLTPGAKHILRTLTAAMTTQTTNPQPVKNPHPDITVKKPVSIHKRTSTTTTTIQGHKGHRKRPKG